MLKFLNNRLSESKKTGSGNLPLGWLLWVEVEVLRLFGILRSASLLLRLKTTTRGLVSTREELV